MYLLSGSGENIWFKKDELHFLYRKTVGDFIATTQATLSVKAPTHTAKRVGCIDSLDTSAAMVSLTVHADGLTAFQYRKKPGTNIEEIKTPIVHPDILQLERRGRSFFVSQSPKSATLFGPLKSPILNYLKRCCLDCLYAPTTRIRLKKPNSPKPAFLRR